MSSIDNSTRKSLQAELNDIQTDHNRKKREIVKSNEADISAIKEYYGEKKETISEQNEAAINHIRSNQQKVAEHAAEERQRLAEKYNSRTQSMSQSYDEKVNSAREKRQEQIAKAQIETRQKVSEIENTSNTRIEQLRNRATEDLKNAKTKYNHDMAQINQFSETRLERQREQNDMTLKGEVERGRSVQERVKTRNEKEVEKTRLRGENQIADVQEKNENKLERLNSTSAREYEMNKKQWESKEDYVNRQYSERIMHKKKANEDQLKNQTSRFQSVYQKNEAAQRESFSIQKENYAKALAETKKDFMQKAVKYVDKADDPFYKVTDRGSYIRENPDFYILRAFVPEHEKDNVKVVIQNDKATVTGQRAFKDKQEQEMEGKTVSSTSFQTFREEFNFDKPVITEGMTRERQGDWVTYHIPKGIPRLDRKA